MVFTCFVISLLLSMYHCTNEVKDEVNEGKMNGEELAALYCGGCHLSPNPSLLPKEHWEGLLQRKGPRLGIKTDFNPYEGKSMQESFNLDTAGVFPKTPQLADSSWQKIVDFYLQQAPDSFSITETPLQETTPLFRPAFKNLNNTGVPMGTMLEIDASTNTIYYGDASGYLYSLDSTFQQTARLRLPSPPVDVQKIGQGDDLLTLSIGLLDPNDIETGVVLKTKVPSFSRRDLVFASLARPVDFVAGDLDGDQEEDLVVCHFGNEVGKLSWYKKNGDQYDQKVIKNVPGASKVLLRDVDADEDLDLVVLFAQGDEGVSIFYNNRGRFKENQILRIPPIYGSSDFDFLDMDGDGDMDIVLANGDNGDKTLILKPYHGVRVFINTGDFNYEERYFFPMHGATKVRASDFDQDGDIDLIASAFYPDFNDLGRKGIVYLDHQGKLEFAAHHFPAAAEGRWLVMDSGDIDQDGDEDVILGSFVEGVIPAPKEVVAKWRSSVDPILVLENTLK